MSECADAPSHWDLLANQLLSALKACHVCVETAKGLTPQDCLMLARDAQDSGADAMKQFLGSIFYDFALPVDRQSRAFYDQFLFVTAQASLGIRPAA